MSQELESIKLILDIAQIIVIPSILWIVRYPLRAIIKRIITKLGGELWIESFWQFKIIDKWKGHIGNSRYWDWASISFIAYKNQNWYFMWKVIEDSTGKVIDSTHTYHTLSMWIQELRNRKKYSFVTNWWIIVDNFPSW